MLMLGAVLLVFTSCEKDEVKLVLQDGTSPAVTLSGTTIAITEDNLDEVLLTMNWTKSDFGIDVAVNYTIEVDKGGNNFANPTEFALENLLTRSFTGAEINTLALNKGEIAAGATGTLEMRVRADVNPNVDPEYSPAATVTITTLEVVIIYPKLYVPGSYQSWTPSSAPTIESAKFDEKYEGYVNFPDPNVEFKFTNAPDWANGIFGDSGDGTTGTIASPGNNFKVADAGYYRLKADITGATWEAVKTSWGLIGNATPGGWDADQDMLYENGVLTITLDLVAGFIKFRANDDWAINLGDDSADAKLEYGGADIAIGEAGNYTIVLDLRASSKYTYTVTKN